MWLILASVGLVVLFAVMDAKAPNALAAFERGLDSTEAGVRKTQRTLTGIGFALIALVTIPLVGFVLFGWIGLVLGMLLGLVLVGRR